MSQEPRYNNESLMEAIEPPMENIMDIINVQTHNYDFVYEELKKFILKMKGNDAYIEDPSCNRRIVYMTKLFRFIMTNQIPMADMRNFLRPMLSSESNTFKLSFDYFCNIFLTKNTNKRKRGDGTLVTSKNLMKRVFFKLGMVFISLYMNKFDYFSIPYALINAALDTIAEYGTYDAVDFWVSFFSREEVQNALGDVAAPSHEYFQMTSQYLYQRAEILYLDKKHTLNELRAIMPITREKTNNHTSVWTCSETAMLPKHSAVLSRCDGVIRARVTLENEQYFLMKYFAQMPTSRYLTVLYFFKVKAISHFYGCINHLIQEIFNQRTTSWVVSNFQLPQNDQVLIEKRLMHLYEHRQWVYWGAEKLLKAILAIIILSTTKFSHQDLTFFWKDEMRTCQQMRTQFTKMIKESDDESECVCHAQFNMTRSCCTASKSFDFNKWRDCKDTFGGVIMFFLYAFTAIPTLYVPHNVSIEDVESILDSYGPEHTFIRPQHYMTTMPLIEMK